MKMYFHPSIHKIPLIFFIKSQSRYRHKNAPLKVKTYFKHCAIPTLMLSNDCKGKTICVISVVFIVDRLIRLSTESQCRWKQRETQDHIHPRTTRVDGVKLKCISISKSPRASYRKLLTSDALVFDLPINSMNFLSFRILLKHS